MESTLSEVREVVKTLLSAATDAQQRTNDFRVTLKPTLSPILETWFIELAKILCDELIAGAKQQFPLNSPTIKIVAKMEVDEVDALKLTDFNIVTELLELLNGAWEYGGVKYEKQQVNGRDDRYRHGFVFEIDD